MAKKRTLKDKVQAASKRSKTPQTDTTGGENMLYSLVDDSSSSKVKTSSPSLLRIDQTYIKKDLLKTVVISVILFCLLIGIYFYLSYNG